MRSQSATQDDLPARTADNKMEPIYYGEQTPILNASALVDVPPIAYDQAQFVAIDEPYDDDQVEQAPLIVNHQVDDDDDLDKESSEPLCPFRDWLFAVLFWLHLAAIIYTGISISPLGYEVVANNFPDVEEEIAKADDVTAEDIEKFKQFMKAAMDYVQLYPMRIVMYIITPVTTLAFMYAYSISVFVAKPFATFVVKSSLFSTVICTVLAMLAIFVSSPSVATVLLAVIAVGASICFVQLLWPMVPFAAINLEVALHSLTDNCGIFVLALFISELTFAWTAYWFYVFVGFVFYESDVCDGGSTEETGGRLLDEGVNCSSDGWLYLLFFISLSWTSSVLVNTIQVTVAGVMATWCFDKNEANGCCSTAVSDSFFRSITYSFGSICLGSFFQGIICMIRCLIGDRRNRHNNDASCSGICLCVSECLGRVLEDVLNIFNRWAYVFVGVYGHPYVQSGRKVMRLFEARGWMAITTENLVGYVLGFTTFVVGLLTGLSALVVERVVHHLHPESEDPSFVLGPIPGFRSTAVGIGFLIGYIMCHVMMNVVKGATNTLIVCWADSPSQFEENHPEKAVRISEAWSQSFPDVMVSAPNGPSTPTAVVVY